MPNTALVDTLFIAAAQPDDTALSQAIADCQAAGVSIRDIVDEQRSSPLIQAIEHGLSRNVEILAPVSDLHRIFPAATPRPESAHMLPVLTFTPAQRAATLIDQASRARGDAIRDFRPETNDKDEFKALVDAFEVHRQAFDSAIDRASRVALPLARALREKDNAIQKSHFGGLPTETNPAIAGIFNAVYLAPLPEISAPILVELYPLLDSASQDQFWRHRTPHTEAYLPGLWALRFAQLSAGSPDPARAAPLWRALADGDAQALRDFLKHDGEVAFNVHNPQTGEPPLLFAFWRSPASSRADLFSALLAHADLMATTLGDPDGNDAVDVAAGNFSFHHSSRIFLDSIPDQGRRLNLARDTDIFHATLRELQARGAQGRLDRLLLNIHANADATFSVIFPFSSAQARQELAQAFATARPEAHPRTRALLERDALAQIAALNDGLPGFSERRALHQGDTTDASAETEASVGKGLSPRRV